MAKKKLFELPNPEVNRLPCVGSCLAKETTIMVRGKEEPLNVPDCDKVFELDDETKVCIAYRNPGALWKQGCALASNKIDDVKDEAVKKLNPLKASKRKKRNR